MREITILLKQDLAKKDNHPYKHHNFEYISHRHLPSSEWRDPHSSSRQMQQWSENVQFARENPLKYSSLLAFVS
jgi:hypothetical protein